MSAALTYQTVSRGLDTLSVAESIVSESKRLGELMEDTEDYRGAAMALDRTAKGAELYARLRGELDSPDGPLTDARWYRLRDTIRAALEPFPEALRAVGAALAGMRSTASMGNAAEPPALASSVSAGEGQSLNSSLTQDDTPDD